MKSLHIRRLDTQTLGETPTLWPVRIAPGALGPDLPRRALSVSPQHRILIESPVVARMTDAPSALVAATHLTDLKGVCRVRPKSPVTYVHLVFDAHEIVEAEGARTESFYPGPQALNALPPVLAREYRAIFGPAPRPAAPLLPAKRARRLVTRHRRNGHDMAPPRSRNAQPKVEQN